MNERSPSIFARMTHEEFIKHLESHGLVPTELERGTTQGESVALDSGIPHSILEVTGQRFGDAMSRGETSAK